MMRLWAGLCSAVLILFVCSGCFPASDSRVDEEKDPHFQRGRSLVNSQDFKGAVEEFEKALENNPRSAAAHFELGWLYDDKIKDYSAAIYHYERHLALRQNSRYAQDVRGRITLCKRELANSEFPLPNTQNFQREIDRLNAENLMLKQRLEALSAQYSAAASSSAVRQQPVMPAQFAQPVQPARSAIVPAPTPTPTPTTTRSAQTSITPTPSRARVHIVKAGETIASIAAQYGLKPNAILSANPNVNPKRMKIGQSINLPGR